MRVLIVDDHVLFRDALRSLLEAHDFDVVGEAEDGGEAIELAHALEPDVVLMDLTMEGMGGLEATRRLSDELPDVATLVLTASEDDHDLFEAIRAGARGYLLKDLESHRFFDLLEGVTRGEPAMTPALARKLLDEFARSESGGRSGGGVDALTDREHQVLELMVKGVTSNRQLAEKMGIKVNTVKFHVQNILDKLHLHSRTEAVAYALRNDIVRPEGDDEP